MSQELNQVKINKITKALYDENVANGTITPTMQQQEVWIFTDDEVYTSAEKTKLNGIEAGAQVNLTKLSELSNDVNFITNSVNNLTNYYTKTNTYTKTEVNDLINGITSMNVAVNTNGTVTIARYGTTANAKIPTTAWLPFEISFPV